MRPPLISILRIAAISLMVPAFTLAVTQSRAADSTMADSLSASETSIKLPKGHDPRAVRAGSSGVVVEGAF
jgi:hypothetical protein